MRLRDRPWSLLLSAGLVIAFIIAGGVAREGNLVTIGSSTYAIPEDSSVVKPVSVDAGYVRFSTNMQQGRLTKRSFSFEYDPRFNKLDHSKYVRLHAIASMPNRVIVRWILWGSKKGEAVLKKMTWGDVICNEHSIKVGLFKSCGFSIVEAGALWQVTFHHEKLKDGNDLATEARSVLRALRH
ncbi:hypothetical protein LQ954_15815 [Sphingomonas sp. IC-11]|uniref:hypothetical protein n=1 Tax=Sphingomonas sp. IC-11 TaxID=2898528 RepID=UPI001E5E7893|nr:hypothetical protein [Sphingomonas sp. IC-11]MCD2317616.1 hypothetical protein [Sphingomonas sp. IC-11]